MLSLPLPVRMFLYAEPADLRSFDGLRLLVRQHLGHDSQPGHLFVFRNKRADRVKLLYREPGGFAIWYKRLEADTFRFPSAVPAVGQSMGAPSKRSETNALPLYLQDVHRPASSPHR